MKITQEYLKSILDYNPKTGEFIWEEEKRKRSRSSGVAGTRFKPKKSLCSYIRIGIDGKCYLAHRLAWLYTVGEWPNFELDHKDRDGTNNKWENLRSADTVQNKGNIGLKKNNKSGYKGVCWNKQNKNWRAVIMTAREVKHLGCFKTKKEAAAAYNKAAKEFYGEFAYTNEAQNEN